MKCKAKFVKNMTADNGDIELTFVTRERRVVQELKELGDVDLSLTVAKYREKRSLDANAYFWVLAQKIAEKLTISGDKPVSAVDVYKEYIKDIGAYEVFPVREEAAEKFKAVWKSYGIGWIVEDLGDSKLSGYKNIKCHYGSSVYDSKQMSRLIDMVKADCDELGIETKTPEELAELKSLWGEQK